MLKCDMSVAEAKTLNSIKKNIHLSGTFRLLCFQMSNFIIRIQSTVQSAGNPRNSSIQTKIKALNCKQITLNLYVFALNSSLSAPFIKIFLLQFISTNIHKFTTNILLSKCQWKLNSKRKCLNNRMNKKRD